ncbi:MAG: hypothetical protein MK078_16525, partial [Crocinitomicaceae bacterium]|nr:hypothetical protein [Crocinitomicaceae bacterium]
MKKTFLLIATFFIVQNLKAQVTSGLFAEWLFNDGTADATVGGVDGVINNAYQDYDRFGCLNHSFRFVPDDYSNIDFGNNYNTQFATPDKSFSISLWFKMESEGLINRTIFNKNGHSFCGDNQRQFHVNINADGKVSFGFYSSLSYGNLTLVQGNT